MTDSDQIYDLLRKKDQQTINAELYGVAKDATREGRYYYQLILEAIASLDVSEQDVLRIAEAVVKHGRAIERIADQLGATYDDAGREEADEYTPGFIFQLIEEADMEEIIDDPTLASEGTIYLQLEPQEEEV